MGIFRKAKETLSFAKGASYNKTPEQREAKEFQHNREKEEKLRFKQELYEEKQKGYTKGAKEHAYKEGLRQGRGQSNSGIGGALGAISGSISHTEKAFGFNDMLGGVGKGLDFGLGLNGPSRPARPATKRTTIRTGGKTITITENTGEQPAVKKKQVSPYSWMEDIDKNNPF